MLDNFSITQLVTKSGVQSEHGVVASQHVGAARVGANILAQGGNAVDAAIATSLALGVLEPWMSGLAAGGCMMVWQAKEKRCQVVNFGMRAPHSLNPADYPLSGKGVASDLFPWQHVVDDRNVMGATAVAVPGLVAGLGLAHATFGTKDWAELVTPAVKLARKGMLTDWYSALMTGANAKSLSADPDTAKYFLDEGKWPIVGGWTSVDERRLDQSALAATLAILRDDGPEAFYKGKIAKQLSQDIQAKGGCLNESDLAAYQAEFVEPTPWSDRWGTLYAAPPLTGGPTLVRAMSLLPEDVFTGTRPTPDTYASIARALTQAFDERLTNMGDHESPEAPGCTTHFSVIDSEGNICSVTQTLLSIFGSRVTSPSTGLLLNNGIMWFDPEPGKPNSLAPGKRCLTNYSPVIGTTVDGKQFGLGASGGRKILGSVMQLSLFLMRHGMSLPEAFHQPRIDVSGGQQILADLKLPDEVIAALQTVLPTNRARRHVYPYAYACPAGVMRQGTSNTGCTEIYSPWGDAVAADSSCTQ
ncbi:MAG: gamma-glutamyltransferase family protein [Burkholderiaceae bacterium]|nr:gamma-glutamyltransferase family protein [Burkholderiaceae bacterium]MCD8516666.1 gamma-glutamyltransferase family protein [Burkholderiaceae bacterium]MCD8536315.1 gamma-glutamyltransferase family protein [Burkholderiaceae bacterium]MCD8564447.1 gamma-glutamyltransferase family protein [Burkholderiaceae bacterium]